MKAGVISRSVCGEYGVKLTYPSSIQENRHHLLPHIEGFTKDFWMWKTGLQVGQYDTLALLSNTVLNLDDNRACQYWVPDWISRCCEWMVGYTLTGLRHSLIYECTRYSKGSASAALSLSTLEAPFWLNSKSDGFCIISLSNTAWQWREKEENCVNWPSG